jgi:hypothetical protein
VYAALEIAPSQLKTKRADFAASKYTRNPQLFANTIDVQLAEATINQLTDLRKDIEAQEDNPDIRAAYLSRLDELIDQNAIKLAAATHNVQSFDEANARIYGPIDSDIFRAECNWIHDDLSKFNPPNAKILSNILPRFEQTEPLTPNITTFTAVKQLHQQHYYQQLLPAGIPTAEMINADAGRKIAQSMIEAIGSDFELVNSPNGLWAVMDNKKVVTAPVSYELDNRTFLGLMYHEIGSHLLEIINGSRQPLQLLRTGLDRYEAGNEGRAYIREQLVFDRPDDYLSMRSWSDQGTPLPSFEYRVSLHLAISLACGLAGERWNFRRCYALLVEMQRMWRRKHALPEDEPACHDFAWHILTMRALKGTDGNGSAYRKDIVYLEGNVHAWQVATKDPEMILRGDIGKFDIANERHCTILRNLGIL